MAPAQQFAPAAQINNWPAARQHPGEENNIGTGKLQLPGTRAFLQVFAAVHRLPPLGTLKIFLRMNGHHLLSHRQMHKNFNPSRRCNHAWNFKECRGPDERPSHQWLSRRNYELQA